MVYSQTFKNGIKVHGFQTGTVCVTKEHYQYSGLGVLRIPKILFGRTFMPEMPVWVWCIQTPHGNYLIDTGETNDFYLPDHFKEKSENFVNRRILKIKTVEENNIDRQLLSVGLSPQKIDAVLMTHLHVDHTDGIRFFDKSEFFIPKKDWEKPFGVPLSTFPKWFKGHEIEYQKSNDPFKECYEFSKEIKIVSTPGHTFGHQSVLLNVDDFHILFAGDMTFSETQLINRKFGGIHLDLKKSKNTIDNILQLADETNLIYLPSHDPESGKRLLNLTTTKVLQYEY